MTVDYVLMSVLLLGHSLVPVALTSQSQQPILNRPIRPEIVKSRGRVVIHSGYGGE